MRVLRVYANEAAPIQRQNFILAGQSNMSGRGSLTGLPTFDNAARIFNFNNAWNWVGGAEPIDSQAGQIDTVSSDNAGVGPSMAFADGLADLRPSMEIGLIPCAKGGSGITAWARSTSRSTLYGSMLARANAAGALGPIAGLLFYQGEEDAKTLAAKNAYAAKLDQFLADVRSDFGDTLPVIITALGPLDAGDFPYRSDIRTIQQAAADSITAVVDAGDLTNFDGVHLNTASQLTLGGRYATAMDGLIG